MDLDSHAVDLESLDESKGIGRRSFLMGALATAGATSLPLNYAARARSAAIPAAKGATFQQGVAAGFPRPRGAILWTRLGGASRSSKLRLVVARDRKFANVVREKDVIARADRDFTAQAAVRGLDPHEEYFYRFVTKDGSSPVGRFRTAPPLNSNEKIKIVFYSCQNYQTGYYNVQRAIAKEKDVDLVICLGDYIYESNQEDDDAIRKDTTGRNTDAVAEFVDEFRQKYRLYKSDPDLRAMHAAHPFLSIWDDHEVENNHAGDTESPATTPGQTNDGHPRRVPYLERRANAYKAYFNYNPRARFKGERDRIYEDYRLGKLVHLITTDERQYRDPQPCNDAIVSPCADKDSPRELLGAAQKDWWKRTMQGSKARWKVWGNQLMVMGFAIDPPNNTDAIMDEWDGYGAERNELMTHLSANGVDNVVAITGDLHNFFAGTVTNTGDSSGTPAMTEFVGGSATSPGLPEETGVSASFFQSLGSVNTHWKYSNFVDRGYGVLEVKPNEVVCSFKRPTTVTQRNGGVVETFAKFRVASGSTTVDQIQ